MITQRVTATPNVQADDKVVIVGAGPVGLMTALLLARGGVHVTLLDKRTEPTCPESRALGIQREVLALLDRVGVVEPIVQHGIGWGEGRLYFKGLEVQRRNFTGDDDALYPLVVNCPQYEVERALYGALDGNPYVDIRLSHLVTDVQQSATGVVVTATDQNGSVSEFSGSYVVGADGVKSAVRKFANIPFEGDGAQGGFFVADFRADLPFESGRKIWFYPEFYPDDFVLMHRFAPTGWRLDWHISLSDDAEWDASPEAAKKRIRTVIGDYDVEILRSNVYNYYQLQAKNLRRDRIFLVGDAAYVVAPFGARGMASGMEDADNLAWKLVRVLRQGESDALLDTYEEERLAAARYHTEMVSSAVEFLVPQNAEQKAHRDDILSRAHADPSTAAQIASGKLYDSYPYRESILTAFLDANGRPREMQFEADALQPGDLMPDGACRTNGKHATVRTALGAQISVVIVGRSDEDTVRLASAVASESNLPTAALVRQENEQLPAGVQQIVVAGEVLVPYLAEEGRLFVVRPDCYIGVIAVVAPDGLSPAMLAEAASSIILGKGAAV